MSADDGRIAFLNAELDRWLWAGKDRTRPRWWGRGEPTAEIRARMRELSELTGRPLVWVMVDPYEGERVEPI